VSFIYSQSYIRERAPQLRSPNSGVLLPQRDWDNATQVTVTGVSIQPVVTTETRDAAGIQSNEDWRIFSQRGVKLDLQVGDRVLWEGRVMDVIGLPQSWPGLTSGWHHSEVLVRAQSPARLSGVGADGLVREGALEAMTPTVPYTP
jgi:hypothetical protein